MASKRAMITGCSSGIGRATAIELSTRGYDVVATARRRESLDDLKVAQALELDVDDEGSVAAAVVAAGPIDVLVNNAGFGVEGAIETVPLGEVRRMFETNFFGAARMIQAFVPGMRERGSGTIVNVTSTAGIAAPPLGGYYAASKFALEALSEALHLEVGHFGVRVLVDRTRRDRDPLRHERVGSPRRARTLQGAGFTVAASAGEAQWRRRRPRTGAGRLGDRRRTRK